MTAGEQRVGGPVSGVLGAHEDQPAVAVRADDRPGGKSPHCGPGQGVQSLFGAGRGSPGACFRLGGLDLGEPAEGLQQAQGG